MEEQASLSVWGFVEVSCLYFSIRSQHFLNIRLDNAISAACSTIWLFGWTPIPRPQIILAYCALLFTLDTRNTASIGRNSALVPTTG